MTDSLDMIERAIIGLRSGYLPNDVVKWLDKGLVARTEGESLDKALGVVKVGQILSETKTNYKKRNRYLHEAFDLVSGDVYWKRIEEFSTQIKRFEVINWQRDKHYTDPPEIYTPFKKLLFKAFALKLGVPTSTSQLYLLLSKNGNS